MNARYPKIQIMFHWLSFLMVIGVYLSVNLRGVVSGAEWRNLVMNIHFTLGILVWVVMFARVGIRHSLWKKKPEIVPAIKVWQEKLADVVHIVLYAIFLAMPIIGGLMVLNNGYPLKFMGIEVISAWPRSEWGYKLKQVHILLANAGILLIGLHAAAALFHHYIVKDNTLLRMMPVRKNK